MPPAKLSDAALIADRAKSGGWKSGEHYERDKERALNLYDNKTLQNQDGVLNVYAVWCWERTNRSVPFEDCKASVLCPGAPIPETHELKDFWRFYKTQSEGRHRESPTAKTLLSRAKAFKAGFHRLTGGELGDEDTEEISRWLRKVLPYEPGSDVYDIEKPKYNFKPPDLDRLIHRLWIGHDLRYTHERNRIQFHLLLLWFCNNGARRGGISALFLNALKAGHPPAGEHYERIAVGPRKDTHKVIYTSNAPVTPDLLRQALAELGFTKA